MGKMFRLPRKRKKKYKQDLNMLYYTSARINTPPKVVYRNVVLKTYHLKENWEWFYFKQRVIDRHKHIYIT